MWVKSFRQAAAEIAKQKIINIIWCVAWSLDFSLSPAYSSYAFEWLSITAVSVRHNVKQATRLGLSVNYNITAQINTMAIWQLATQGIIAGVTKQVSQIKIGQIEIWGAEKAHILVRCYQIAQRTQRENGCHL